MMIDVTSEGRSFRVRVQAQTLNTDAHSNISDDARVGREIVQTLANEVSKTLQEKYGHGSKHRA